MLMDVEITLVVDGQRHTLRVDPRTTLLDGLHERLDSPMGSKAIAHRSPGERRA